ncbi:MAG TPA: ATP-dependent metallopeptidase FtsH/Yme1/Tma family protein [Candidatus Aerophobetes bacterium]|uniref:ATP-dependent zinc metalloprotease FtsH n=1 Tax=Aerophobetes bacterium TaxID=2030807 RepID=A0A7V5I065_UNCAE|nr:ATP-dependent metallopeptidase FtsH/Yme1/Tma family protein [Candidatus Aerophobetes bacterium]
MDNKEKNYNNKKPPSFGPSPGNRLVKNLFLLVIAFIVIISLFNFVRIGSEGEKNITYSQFVRMVENGSVSKVVIKGKSIKGMVDGAVVTTYAPDDPELINMLRKNNVEIEVVPQTEGWWVNLVGGILPVIIFIGIWFWIFRQMRATGNRALSFGKSKAKMVSKEKVKVTFDDVAGAEEAKEELREIIEFLKNPGKFQKMGAKIPKGVLLVGPPGCGKTLLARAVAGEAGVPFFSISGSDFVEMFVGVGAARVRDLFDQARKNAPCIIFIDELDAVGRQRFAGIGGGHDEKEQTLNQLLVELDGFSPREGIIVMGATNRPDVLDAALLRAGRFDRRITINVPDIREREEILKLHMRNKPIGPDVDVKVLARRTPGFVGSDLENLVNEASLLAARRNKDRVGMAELEEAIERVIAGPEKKSRVMREKEKRIVAYHEAGHALVGNLLPNADPIHKVSIIPRGSAALGYTLQLPLEDRYLTTRSELMDRLTVLLAGRASEELIFNEISTGAQNDLSQATHIVRKMITEYGMSEKLGPVALHTGTEEVFLGRDLLKERNYSEKLAYEVDKEVTRIIEEAYKRAYNILKENKEKLVKLAEELERREVLEENDIKKILGEKVTSESTQAKAFEKEEEVESYREKKQEKKEEEDIEGIIPHPTVEGEARS